jgi:hypothetical protein
VAKPVHTKIEIRSKNPDSVLTYANAQILVDGVPLRGVVEATLRFPKGEVARLDLTMVGDISVQMMGDLNQTVFKVEEPKSD